MKCTRQYRERDFNLCKKEILTKGDGVHSPFRVMRLGKLYGFTDKLFVEELFSIACEALLSVCNQFVFLKIKTDFHLL